MTMFNYESNTFYFKPNSTERLMKSNFGNYELLKYINISDTI